MAGGGFVRAGGEAKEYPGKMTLFVFLACLVAATGGLIFGYDIGISGGVTSMDSFLEKFFPSVYRKEKADVNVNQYCKFDSQLLTMFTSSLYLAALVASFCASTVTRVAGRKWSMLAGGVTFLIGSAINGAAVNVFMLILGRILLGVGVGFANQSVPVYLSEMAPARHRGLLNIGFQLMITIGIFAANLINYGTSKIKGGWGWRVSLALAAVPAGIITVGSLFLPDTPNSLIDRGYNDKARAMLRRVRGTDDIDAEYNDLLAASIESKKVHLKGKPSDAPKSGTPAPATMPDDITDDLQGMSFGSSERSDTVSASTSSSSSSSGGIGAPARPHAAGDRCMDAVRRIGADLSIGDLRFVQRLGSGAIGSVYLAELKRKEGEGWAVAAKVMDKKELEGRNKEGRARTERAILEVLDHPFLPRLYGAVQNERWSCLLTEFCPGGDLHVLRQRQQGKRFDEAAVRFYAAEVVVAMEYMHMMGIIYRDLKPENVLVRSDGHIMITDFDLSLKCDGTLAQLISDRNPLSSASPIGAAAISAAASCILPNCIVSCFQPKTTSSSSSIRRKKPSRPRGPTLEFVAEPVDHRSMSFVGTHEYLAPEIVAGEGHGSSVDWWTLGVFVYELLYGVTPFRGDDNELTLANIVARALEFPKEPTTSAAARDLISGLLAKDPAKRLGSTTGAAAVKRHPFFAAVNWALLRCAAPPYVPPPYSSASSCNSRELSEDDSCPGTPVEYY